MPLVKHNDLPLFDYLISEGKQILPMDKALMQDIRELHVGFINMMPDQAIEATERQWLRLLSEASPVAQIHVHLVDLSLFERGEKAKKHIEKYYEDIESVMEEGLDALIITGANEETNPPVTDEETWAPLKEVLEWAYENVASTICACLATHALMYYQYNQKFSWRETKQLGIFSHLVANRSHPLVRSMNTSFDAPHSRFSEISQAQFENAKFNVLAASEDAGVYLAASPDGFRQICLQGHPEYDLVSLLKEFKRDLLWRQEGVLGDINYPKNFFNTEAEKIIIRYLADSNAGREIDFPEPQLISQLNNTWGDSGRTLLSAWVGYVYQTTNIDRTKQFMDGINPDSPLGEL